VQADASRRAIAARVSSLEVVDAESTKRHDSAIEEVLGRRCGLTVDGIGMRTL